MSVGDSVGDPTLAIAQVEGLHSKGDSMPQRICIVGLGAMGKPIAGNFLKAGFQTTVWNRTPGPVHELVSIGAVAAEELRQVFKCGFILSTLFDDIAVRQVFLDSNVLAYAPAGVIHICMSTISSSLANELVQEHTRHGISYVAAPMFGRPNVAAAAQLNIVTAAAPDLLEKVEPILRVLGKTWPVGDDPRIAHVAKIAGNFMIGCAIETMAESAALISLNGGDPGLFLAMLGETLFNSFIYRSYGSAIASGKSPGLPSGLQLPLKDVELTVGEANALGTRTPFATLLREQLQLAERGGYGREDWSTALASVARLQHR